MQHRLYDPRGDLMARLLIADPHAVARGGLQEILSSAPDLEVVAEAMNATQLLERAAAEGPIDLAILDITLPDANGWELVDTLRRRHPSLPLLLFTLHAEPQIADRALKAGVNGYLSKESTPDEV